MVPKIVELKEVKVVGLSKTFEEAALAKELPILQNNFRERADEISLKVDDHLINVCIKKVGTRVTHFVGTEVNSYESIPEGMEDFTIPSQSCIFFEHQGSQSTVWKSFSLMYKWAKDHHCLLDTNGFKIDVTITEDPPVHELYIKLADKIEQSAEKAV
ncbi:putative transcriptional regulator YdeE [Bacillus ectoiniformans]|uniref:GyrI-like domain-containing protein n=1 Tax=Bacillus ectoiniformans TaxID=1494429 RepID=UPI00195C83F6|nr:GyrI-like domain-containing protein [Bacillus ectoiniformans]MBM7648247.1 putative transcriptional regulator YdeE [Bacillus ectoiniformans]